jgi:heat shock protein HslJ
MMFDSRSVHGLGAFTLALLALAWAPGVAGTVTSLFSETFPRISQPAFKHWMPVAMARNNPLQSMSLLATHWELISITQNGIISQPPRLSQKITLTFESEKTVSGSSGCNRYGANYILAGDEVRFSNISSTRMGCAEEIMRFELLFLDSLGHIERAERLGFSTLVLRSTVSDVSLKFSLLN